MPKAKETWRVDNMQAHLVTNCFINGAPCQSNQTARINGVRVFFRIDTKKWIYSDGTNAHGEEKQARKCPNCDKLQTAKGHDACLGELDGVIAACCGHGVTKPYVMFRSGRRLEFQVGELNKNAGGSFK